MAGRYSQSWPTRSWTVAFVAGLALAVFATATVVGASDVETSPTPADFSSALERMLIEGLHELQRGDLDAAHDRISSLVEQQPDFRLAHLIRGDMLMARGTGLSRFGQGLPQEEKVADLLSEARARWSRYRRSPPPRAMPEGLLKVPEVTPSVLVVNLQQNRLFVLENRGDRLTKTLDFYVSIGKNGVEKQTEGDERTPVGYYLVSGYLAGETLPDLYGTGAFPLTYPNGWDRLHGRTGSGIWIHGTESTTYSRPPRSSRGCLTLSNQDFQTLREAVEIENTPVLVASDIEWVTAEHGERRRRHLEARVEAWRRAWESRDTTHYLDFYSDEFRTDGMDLSEFGAYKKSVNEGKRFIRVRLEEVGIYAYPGESDLVVVDFLQHYESDTFKASTRKHQYWRREAEGWRIVFEERV